jgi:hypothetical protein
MSDMNHGDLADNYKVPKLYNADELALNQAAIVREAADLMDCVYHGKSPHPSCTICIRDKTWRAAILAIPADQPALDRYVAECVREEAEWWWSQQAGEYMNSALHKRADARLAALRAAASPVSHE